ncbi:MAG: hypothetical protein BroJett021_06580 [Chloroflexota bacterium]|nr:ParB N-terminal domain-containing protein [Caldilinea sp.]GIK71670.1 MAG: hypothetical protein BroJett021_06580 [Chloroflexota bacterium]
MSDVTVRSIDALEELQAGLIRYADQTQATLDAVQREVQRTLDWLDERVQHWQNEVRRSQEMVQQAALAYQRCMASGDREHPPACGHLEAAVYEARRRLAQVEAEARMAAEARKAVLAEVESYRREAGRLRALVQDDTPKAVETLRYKVSALRSYAVGGFSTGDVVAGALAFGVGYAVGAVIGAVLDSSRQDDAAESQPAGDSEGREPPLQQLHPDIHTVPIDQIDLSDSPVHSAADFHKVSRDEMIEGLTKLRLVQQWIEQGATDQMLRDFDAQHGLSGAQGYHNIYQVFYGDNAIALEQVGDGYRVINGYHRLAVAQELGWTMIPARVVR